MTINIPDNYKLFKRDFKVSPVEFYRIQLTLICPDVTDTKLTVLSYLYHYGYKVGFSKLLEDRIVTSKASLFNVISHLRKDGLIIGHEEEIKLVEDIKLYDEDQIQLIYLTKDPDNDEVKHRYFRI